jgi:hypothetical protein
MEIKLTRSTAPRKDDRIVIFHSEHVHSVQFLRTAFGDTIPETITVSGEFAAPKIKESKEARKARLGAMTPAEKIAAAEERVRKALARIEAQKAQLAVASSAKTESAKTAPEQTSKKGR